MNREIFLDSIKPDMKLTWDFFKQVYGFDISYLGFAEEALQKLESVGCGKAREYYETWVEGYETEHNASMKKVADWYKEHLDNEENARRREVLQKWRKIFQTEDRSTLESLLVELLKAGVDVESFVTEVLQSR